MVSKKKLHRDLYRLCNASFFREYGDEANVTARLKIMLGCSHDDYMAIPLHERITVRGSQYVKELDYQWTYYDRLYTLRFVVDSDKFRVQKSRSINKDF